MIFQNYLNDFIVKNRENFFFIEPDLSFVEVTEFKNDKDKLLKHLIAKRVISRTNKYIIELGSGYGDITNKLNVIKKYIQFFNIRTQDIQLNVFGRYNHNCLEYNNVEDTISKFQYILHYMGLNRVKLKFILNDKLFLFLRQLRRNINPNDIVYFYDKDTISYLNSKGLPLGTDQVFVYTFGSSYLRVPTIKEWKGESSDYIVIPELPNDIWSNITKSRQVNKDFFNTFCIQEIQKQGFKVEFVKYENPIDKNLKLLRNAKLAITYHGGFSHLAKLAGTPQIVLYPEKNGMLELGKTEFRDLSQNMSMKKFQEKIDEDSNYFHNFSTEKSTIECLDITPFVKSRKKRYDSIAITKEKKHTLRRIENFRKAIHGLRFDQNTKI